MLVFFNKKTINYTDSNINPLRIFKDVRIESLYANVWTGIGRAEYKGSLNGNIRHYENIIENNKTLQERVNAIPPKILLL